MGQFNSLRPLSPENSNTAASLATFLLFANLFLLAKRQFSKSSAGQLAFKRDGFVVKLEIVRLLDNAIENRPNEILVLPIVMPLLPTMKSPMVGPAKASARSSLIPD